MTIKNCYIILNAKNCKTEYMTYKPFLILILILLPISSFSTPNKILVKSFSLETKEFFDQFKTYGECKNEQSKDYYSIVDGTVDFLSIKQGDFVKAGEMVIAVNQKIADTIKSHAEASFKSAEAKYNKDKTLFAKNIISLEVLRSSETNFEDAKARLAETLRKYNDMIITAPYDGYIGVIKVLIGTKVKANDYLFSLISESDSDIFFELPEILHQKVTPSTEVRLIDNSGKEVTANIAAVSPYISKNGTITTKVTSKEGKCIHGSYIKARFFIDKHQGLAAPEQAVLQNDKGSFVYKVNNDNTVKQIYIKTAMRTKGMIEISSDNLTVNDKIVLEGLTKVYDGALVEYSN